MENLESAPKLYVKLSGDAYTIHFLPSISDAASLLNTMLPAKQLFLVTNKTIAPHYLDDLKKGLDPNVVVDEVMIEDGEHFKNQDSLNQIYQQLMNKNHHRDTTLLALGGGVIGDLTGFAAATYQRGVAFIQMPTTLLAMVDASVGGKTAINHPKGKNLIGSFYHPRAVLMPVDTVKTLPLHEFRSGMAEVIKYGLLAGGELFDELNSAQNLDYFLKNQRKLIKIITECCKIKVKFVQSDEKERGERALLNLGHTFAHALEATTGYERWRHGEAVAIGLYCASLLSYRCGHTNPALVTTIREMLRKFGLPYQVPKDIPMDHLIEAMRMDKKVKRNKMRFILIHRPGACFLSADVTETQLRATLREAVEGEMKHE